MTTLTCPRCRGDNAVAVGASGYVCRQCTTTWRFVTCASCQTTWHAGPDVTAWTCKRCGHHNVGEAGAAAGPGAGPLPPAGGTPAGGQQSALAGLGDRWRGLGPRGKGIALLVPVLL